MMTRQVARQFCRLGEVHSLIYGHRASGENGRKLTASTRVGSESRLMDYLGLTTFNLCYRHGDPRHEPDEPGYLTPFIVLFSGTLISQKGSFRTNPGKSNL